MKQLIALTTILIVIGIGGFMYRNALERPIVIQDSGACTQEAKLCPDGTSVGRTGHSCAFAACALPNAEDQEIGISFVIPAGYVYMSETGDDAPNEPRVVMEKPSLGDLPHILVIYQLQIPEGKTAEDTVLAHAKRQLTGDEVSSLKDLNSININQRTYLSMVTERFEGQIGSAYYFLRESDVLIFQIVERDISDWTNPELDTASLPEHKALLTLLTALQTN